MTQTAAPLPSLPEPELSKKPANDKERFVFIDGLRGVAALAVVIFHVYHFGVDYPVGTILHPIVGQILVFGARGVNLFFVISGFVIAYSVRQKPITARFFGNFALRRSIRLDPLYWVCLTMMIGLRAFASVLTPGAKAPLPPAYQVIGNYFYCQNIFNFQNILNPSWTLCYEVQFYIVLVSILWLAGANRTNAAAWRRITGPALFIALALASLVFQITSFFPDRIFIDRWYEFFLGVLICWVMLKQIRLWVLILYFAAALATAIYCNTQENYSTIVFTVLIAIGALGGFLSKWLKNRVFQYFGKISYSLYLGHAVIMAALMYFLHHFTKQSVAGSIVNCFLAFIICVAFSHLLYFLIERPSHNFAKKIRMSSAPLPANPDTAASVSTPSARPT